METELRGQTQKVNAHTTRLDVRTEVKMLSEIDKMAFASGLNRSIIARLLINEGMKHLDNIKLL